MRMYNSGHFLSAYSVYVDKQLSSDTLNNDNKLSAYTLYADKAKHKGLYFYDQIYSMLVSHLLQKYQDHYMVPESAENQYTGSVS